MPMTSFLKTLLIIIIIMFFIGLLSGCKTLADPDPIPEANAVPTTIDPDALYQTCVTNGNFALMVPTLDGPGYLTFACELRGVYSEEQFRNRQSSPSI